MWSQDGKSESESELSYSIGVMNKGYETGYSERLAKLRLQTQTFLGLQRLRIATSTESADENGPTTHSRALSESTSIGLACD
jgi:hypothetical protein